jgi:hypothetical protein
MERESGDDVCRYANVGVPGHMAAMVFSNTHEDKAVLKMLEVITGNDPVRPCSRGIDGKHCKRA